MATVTEYGGDGGGGGQMWSLSLSLSTGQQVNATKAFDQCTILLA